MLQILIFISKRTVPNPWTLSFFDIKNRTETEHFFSINNRNPNPNRFLIFLKTRTDNRTVFAKVRKPDFKSDRKLLIFYYFNNHQWLYRLIKFKILVLTNSSTSLAITKSKWL